MIAPAPFAGKTFTAAMDLAARIGAVRRKLLRLEPVDALLKTKIVDLSDELLWLQDDTRSLAMNILCRIDPLDG